MTLSPAACLLGVELLTFHQLILFRKTKQQQVKYSQPPLVP